MEPPPAPWQVQFLTGTGVAEAITLEFLYSRIALFCKLLDLSGFCEHAKRMDNLREEVSISRTGRNFSMDFKGEAVRLLTLNRCSVAQVAREFAIRDTEILP